MSVPTGDQPADRTDVRATNLAVVLRHVTAHAPCSRADIAAATGLTKATVSSLVGDLIERRLLRETGATAHRVGRPATMIELDGAPYASIGLDVGAGRLTLVALDPAGRRLLTWRRATAGDGTEPPGRTLAGAAALTRRAAGRLRGEGRRVLGLTVGVPGRVDGDGLVRRSPELGWQDVPARDLLTAALGAPFPVTVADSAVLAAKAEHRYGAHAGTADLVHLTGTTRVRAGIITGGAVLRGDRGLAGSLGHLPAGDPDPAAGPDPGPACGCGCGRVDCLDAVATTAALAHRLDPKAPVTDLDAALDDAVRRARAGDPEVVGALADFGRRLGTGLAHVAELLDPAVLILGGHYARVAPWMLPSAGAALRRTPDDRMLPSAGAALRRAPDGGPLLVASTLGHEAAALGGAGAALDVLDAGRLPGPAPD